MERLLDGLVVVALFALRLGVPLLITLIVARLLSRLDAKWQAEEAARQERALLTWSDASARRCWEIRGCDPAARENCPAFRQWPLPCWEAYRHAIGRVPERCFGCEVFTTA